MSRRIDGVKILFPSLEEDGEVYILRGVIDINSLERIKIPDYQRETPPPNKLRTLTAAYLKGEKPPDITIGYRSGNYETHTDGSLILRGPLFCVDGQHRLQAAKMALAQGAQLKGVGATIHFNSSWEYEFKLFDRLNTQQRRLSINVTLRNGCHSHPSLATLKGLAETNSFPLHGMVSFGQYLAKSDVVTFITVVRVAAELHQRFSSGRTGLARIGVAMDRQVEIVGVEKFTANVLEFFRFYESAYRLSTSHVRFGGTATKQGFMRTMARFLGSYDAFWDGQRLVIPDSVVRKLTAFPLNDPRVESLAGGDNVSRTLLLNLVVDHYKNGQKPKGLPRLGEAVQIEENNDETE